MTADTLGNHTTSQGGMDGRWYEVVGPFYYCTIPPYHLKKEKSLSKAPLCLCSQGTHTKSLRSFA